MKKYLLTLIIITTLASLSAQKQFHYELVLNTSERNVSASNKEIINFLRTKGLHINNYHSHEEVLTFESTEDFDSSLIAKYLKTFNNTKLFEYNKEEINHIRYSQFISNDHINVLCSETSFTGRSEGSSFTNHKIGKRSHTELNLENCTNYFYIYIAESGLLELNIDPHQSTDDFDFAIWGPLTSFEKNEASIKTAIPVRFSYAEANGSIGMKSNPTIANENELGFNWDDALPVQTGEMYLVMIDNFSKSGKQYSVSWSGNAKMDCSSIVNHIDYKEVKNNSSKAAK